jgi:hypothetical protein
MLYCPGQAAAKLKWCSAEKILLSHLRSLQPSGELDSYQLSLKSFYILLFHHFVNYIQPFNEHFTGHPKHFISYPNK